MSSSSSPIAIDLRPTSPSSFSDASYGTSASSNSGAPHALTYTREELLYLASSPLAQGDAPAALTAFPALIRRRGGHDDKSAARISGARPPQRKGRTTPPTNKPAAAGAQRRHERQQHHVADTTMWWRTGSGSSDDGSSPADRPAK